MVKFLFCFLISFLVLSIPIKKKQFFYYLDQWANPYTRPVLKRANIFMRKHLAKIEILGIKVISGLKEEPSDQTILTVSPSSQQITFKTRGKSQIKEKVKKGLSPLELNKKSEVLGTEYYSEKELLQLKEMLKNSDI